MCGCVHATGCDIKAFCVGPIYALVHAAGLVKAGMFHKVVVVGGGCMAKLGMKFKGHVANDMPILWRPHAAENLLVGFFDGQKRFLGVGVLHGVDYGRKTSESSAIERKPVFVVLEGLGQTRTQKKAHVSLHRGIVFIEKAINSYRLTHFGRDGSETASGKGCLCCFLRCNDAAGGFLSLANSAGFRSA